MLRARLAKLTLAAGLGLAAGCHGTASDHSLFSRGHPGLGRECMVGDMTCVEGPVLQDFGPYTSPEGYPGTQGMPPQPGAYPGLTPQPSVPPLNTPPRLEPYPTTPPFAQPEPYTPGQPTRKSR